MNIVVVSASLSESSATSALGRQLTQATLAALSHVTTQATTQVIELREIAQDIVNAALTGFPSPRLDDTFTALAQADGVVAVTPAYNASYSGLFKLFFDVLPEDTLRNKPVAIGVTGGTPRHSLVTEHAVRPLFTYLHARTTPTAIYVATEDFGQAAHDSDGDAGSALARRTTQIGQELAFLMAGTQAIASNNSKPGKSTTKDSTRDPAMPEPVESNGDATAYFPDFVPFDQL